MKNTEKTKTAANIKEKENKKRDNGTVKSKSKGKTRERHGSKQHTDKRKNNLATLVNQ